MADKQQNIVVNWKVNTAELQRSQASVNKAQKATDDLRKSTQNYGKDATKAGAESTKAFDNVAKEIQGLNQGFGQLIGTVKTLFAALAIREIAQTSLEIAKLAGNVEGVERAFRKLPDSTNLLNKLRESTKGTVSDFQLMQTAIKAQNFQIPLQQLGTLLEFAAAKAQQTGESVEYLVDSIITGIGRESPLILDNLQLRFADLKKVMDQTGASLAQAVGVVAQEQLKQMGGLAETGAVKVDKLSAAWKNFLSGASTEFYKESGLGSVIDKLTDKLSFEKAEQQFKNQLQLFREFGVEFTGGQQSLIQRAATGQNFSTEEVKLVKDEIEKLRKTVAGLAVDYDIFTIKEIGAEEALQRITTEFEKHNLLVSDARKNAVNFIQAVLAQQQATSAAARSLAQQRLEELRAEQDKRRAMEVQKQLAKEIFMAGEAEKLQAEVSKVAAEEIEKLAKAYKLADVNLEGFNSNIQQSIDDVRAYLETIKETPAEATIRTFGQVVGDAFKEVREELLVGGIDITNQFLQSTINAEVEAYDARIQALQSFYDEQISLAGDNERAKSELRLKEQRELDDLRKRQASKEKEARKFSVLIDTAAALARIWINPGFPLAIPYSALIVAQGAAQLAAINRAQVRLAKGALDIQGPGTSTSDSIPAMLSKGESVMTANETSKSYNVLKEVRAGRLDDRVLAALQNRPSVNVSGMDDSRIVAAIKAQSYPDIIRVGSMVYEAKKTGEVHKKIVKKYSFG